jgi:hypothetical protein
MRIRAAFYSYNKKQPKYESEFMLIYVYDILKAYQSQTTYSGRKNSYL